MHQSYNYTVDDTTTATTIECNARFQPVFGNLFKFFVKVKSTKPKKQRIVCRKTFFLLLQRCAVNIISVAVTAVKQYREYYNDYFFAHIHIWFVCCFKNEPIWYHSVLWWSHVISLKKNLNYILYISEKNHIHFEVK